MRFGVLTTMENVEHAEVKISTQWATIDTNRKERAKQGSSVLKLWEQRPFARENARSTQKERAKETTEKERGSDFKAHVTQPGSARSRKAKAKEKGKAWR